MWCTVLMSVVYWGGPKPGLPSMSHDSSHRTTSSPSSRSDDTWNDACTHHHTEEKERYILRVTESVNDCVY